MRFKVEKTDKDKAKDAATRDPTFKDIKDLSSSEIDAYIDAKNMDVPTLRKIMKAMLKFMAAHG